MNRKLFTIGYTGFSIDEFAAQLADSGIECLIDVREIPISRKRGFSKTALRERLKESGIDYRHYRLLGSPSVLRHEVRITGNFDNFFDGVNQHLSQSESQCQVIQVIEIARHARSCLMCCCCDWQLCHRKSVVEAILRHTYFAVDHLAQNSVPVIRRRAA